MIVTLLFGGDETAIAPLLVLTLKVATVSLASITVFSGLDPDHLANGLMWYGCPEKLSFSISYAYRMLPLLMEEFQSVLLSYRLRGNPPAHDTFLGKIRYLIYQIRVIIHSFYPLMLNTAKRSRTTVEVLEIKGYRYAAVNKEVKKVKLSTMKVTNNDGMFLALSFLWGGGYDSDLPHWCKERRKEDVSGFSHTWEVGEVSARFPSRIHNGCLTRRKKRD